MSLSISTGHTKKKLNWQKQKKGWFWYFFVPFLPVNYSFLPFNDFDFEIIFWIFLLLPDPFLKIGLKWIDIGLKWIKNGLEWIKKGLKWYSIPMVKVHFRSGFSQFQVQKYDPCCKFGWHQNVPMTRSLMAREWVGCLGLHSCETGKKRVMRSFMPRCGRPLKMNVNR